ncbi:MAG: hypothetical protein LUD74_00740 [Tannerellaceae bacterium]|nr:hypothetical protein [Tannerellaceae bacterium]
MKKEYKLPEPESEIGLSQNSQVKEPAIRYGYQKEAESLPAITEEELKDTISGDELLDRVYKFIDDLFEK